MIDNFVLGATGAVGEFLLPALLARGERVFALSRSTRESTATERIEWLRGDLFGAMPALPVVDTVFSVGPLDAFVSWFDTQLASGASAPRKVVALSSMSAESKKASIDSSERELAERLHIAEMRLIDTAARHGSACTILRATLIYGSGRDRSLAPLARFARRWRVLPLPRDAYGLRQPVHAEDLARACIGAREVAASAGHIYATGGAERLRFDEMLARIAALSPRRALALRVPIRWLAFAARIARRPMAGAGALSRLQVDLVADNSAATRDFGYEPRPFRADEVLPDKRPVT